MELEYEETNVLSVMEDLTISMAKVCCAVYLKPQCIACMAHLADETKIPWVAAYALKQDGPPQSVEDTHAFLREWVVYNKELMEEALKQPCTQDASNDD